MKKLALLMLSCAMCFGMDAPQQAGDYQNKLAGLCFDSTGLPVDLRESFQDNEQGTSWVLWRNGKPISQKVSDTNYPGRYTLKRLNDGTVVVINHAWEVNDEVWLRVFDSNGQECAALELCNPMATACTINGSYYSVEGFYDNFQIGTWDAANKKREISHIACPHYEDNPPAGTSCWQGKLPYRYRKYPQIDCFNVGFLDIEAQQCIEAVASSENGQQINRANITPEGVLFYGCGRGEQAALMLRDVRSKTQIAALKSIFWAPEEDDLDSPHPPLEGALVLTPENNSTYFATVESNGIQPVGQAVVSVWDLRTVNSGKPVSTRGTALTFSRLCDLSPDGKKLCGVNAAGEVRIVDLQSGISHETEIAAGVSSDADLVENSGCIAF
jgi:hypothetical protein